MSYYAIHRGHKTGIFEDWKTCKKNVDGYKNAVFKKFSNIKDAKVFVKNGFNNKSILNYFKNNELEEFIPEISVYTDGACSNNGKKTATAGIGVYFGENDSRNVSSRISGKQSNNIAELKAILKACEILEQEIKDNKKIMIYTDSNYSILCCTTYGNKLSKKGWTKKEPIPNIELVKKAYYFFENNNNVRLTYVKAHTLAQDKHSIGNENADRLANQAIGIKSCISQKIYLNVPFTEKDNAKKLGARWDSNEKKWYFLNSINKENQNKLLIYK